MHKQMQNKTEQSKSVYFRDLNFRDLLYFPISPSKKICIVTLIIHLPKTTLFKKYLNSTGRLSWPNY